MDIPQTTPLEAHDTLGRHPEAVYLDVRTPAEFEAGHPAGACNVPVVLFDPAGGRPRPNPDFVATIERRIPRTAKILVGCQAGGRSQHASELLAQAGYTDVSNVRGGFGGGPDISGRMIPGWAAAGLPVEAGPERTRD